MPNTRSFEHETKASVAQKDKLESQCAKSGCNAGFLRQGKAGSRAEGERMPNTRSFEHEPNAAMVQKDKLQPLF